MTNLSAADCDFIQKVRKSVNETMFGLEPVINALLVALTTRGHVLLEGNPGLGKTALVKALSEALGLPTSKVGRIQFTPDLMPSDITGTLMPEEDNVQRLKFQEGPIFCWILLADEINRATPKTQAAMLEAMAERQVTVLNKTWPLTPPIQVTSRSHDRLIEPPFMVMATQNPIDLEGTYELPEAQSDRFMFKILMPFPGADILKRIIDKEAMGGDGGEDLADQPSDKRTEEQANFHEVLRRLDNIGRAIKAAEPLPSVRQHIINMVIASKGLPSDDLKIVSRSKVRVRALVHEYFDFPLGPRAALALMLGAKGWEIVALTEPEGIDNIGSRSHVGLACVALPALRHRLKLKLDWERRYREEMTADERISPDRVHNELLYEFFKLTAPEDSGYRETLEAEIDSFGEWI